MAYDMRLAKRQSREWRKSLTRRAIVRTGAIVISTALLAASATPVMSHNGRSFCASIIIDAKAQPFSDALWCGSGGATRTVAQNQYDGTGNFVHPGCTKYVSTYGRIDRNELLRLAILDARQERNLDAVEKIAACQCHNQPVETLVRQKGKELVCLLGGEP
jgi:hypothetical protein